MTRGEMMARMSAREYDDWMAYMQLYPISERAADLRAGTIAAMIANVNRDEKRRPTPFTAADVFPWLAGDAAPEETPEDQVAAISALYAAHGLLIVDAPKDA